MTAAAKKIKTTATVFELPQRLGILQDVEYEPPRGWCTDRCLYEGVLTAEGCRKGLCVRYRVWVHSRDRRRWRVREAWRRRRRLYQASGGRSLWVPAVLPLRGGLRWGDTELQVGGGEDEGPPLHTTRRRSFCGSTQG